MPISEIDDERVKEYRGKRTVEKIIKHGKPSKKTVSQTTINKEVSTLRKFLRLARKKGFNDSVKEFKMAPERVRRRVLTDEEGSARGHPGMVKAGLRHGLGNMPIR